VADSFGSFLRKRPTWPGSLVERNNWSAGLVVSQSTAGQMTTIVVQFRRFG